MTNKYYRYEAKHPEQTSGEWVGIFQAMNPDERRQWYCLAIPKWYKTHPDADSKAWFTEYGYAKWRSKMEQTIENFHFGMKAGWEFRVVEADTLDNVVSRGKTQIIQERN